MTHSCSLAPLWAAFYFLIHAQHKPKHKLEKWFIISGDGVRTYVTCTYVQNKTKQKQTDQS